MTGLEAANGPRSQTWGTPWPIVQAIEGALGRRFDLDVAAAADSAKAPRFYAADDDGLTSPWSGLVWCNPPYRKIGPWVDRALRYAREEGGDSVLLLPSRTSTGWFKALRGAEADGRAVIVFWPSRIAFIGAGGNPYESSIAAYVSPAAYLHKLVLRSLEGLADG